MKTYKVVNFNKSATTSWLFVVIILIASVLIVITLMGIIRHKSKTYFCQSLVNGWLMNMILEM